MTVKKQVDKTLSNDTIQGTTFNSPVLIVRKNENAASNKRLMIDFAQLNSVSIKCDLSIQTTKQQKSAQEWLIKTTLATNAMANSFQRSMKKFWLAINRSNQINFKLMTICKINSMKKMNKINLMLSSNQLQQNIHIGNREKSTQSIIVLNQLSLDLF